MKRVNICGVHISAINPHMACDAIKEWVENRRKAYVCVVPVSIVVDCQADKEYRMIINNADMATPDGVPLVWLGRLKGYKMMERTYGPDLMLDVCKMSQENDYRHYFYGSTTETCRLLESKLKERFPRLSIIGKFSPPFREMTYEEERRVIEEINRLKPDILWIGLGSPKQDYWMVKYRDKLEVPVMIGVGAAFDFISGIKKQAPRWMRRAGLEWFFRLCCEPKRLWKRYLIGNSKFIYFLLRDLVISRKG